MVLDAVLAGWTILESQGSQLLVRRTKLPTLTPVGRGGQPPRPHNGF